MSNLITYEQLFETLRSEKKATELQQINNNFTGRVSEYLCLLSDNNECLNAYKILKEINLIRLNKILNGTLNSVRCPELSNSTENMTEEEKILFSTIKSVISKRMENIESRVRSHLINKKQVRP